LQQQKKEQNKLMQQQKQQQKQLKIKIPMNMSGGHRRSFKRRSRSRR
jgi:hypothetical protein